MCLGGGESSTQSVDEATEALRGRESGSAGASSSDAVLPRLYITSQNPHPGALPLPHHLLCPQRALRQELLYPPLLLTPGNLTSAQTEDLIYLRSVGAAGERVPSKVCAVWEQPHHAGWMQQPWHCPVPTEMASDDLKGLPTALVRDTPQTPSLSGHVCFFHLTPHLIVKPDSLCLL